MFLRSRSQAEPFTTKDGSTIRSLLDLSCAPVRGQSLAEAEVGPGQATTRHRHPSTEEFYYCVEGSARLEVGGEVRSIREGDAVLIPAGEPHQIYNSASKPVRILCCCAPAYRHEDTELLPDGPALA